MRRILVFAMLMTVVLILAGCSCKHETTELRDAVSATCAVDGYTGDIFCTECGELVARGEVVKAEGHKLTEPMNAQQATCYNTGYTGDVYCSFCGEMVTMGQTTERLTHIPGEREYVSEPTCNSYGYTGDVHCTLCDDIVEYGESIDRLAHTPAEDRRDAYEATCTSRGYTGDIYCQVCDEWIEGGEYTDYAAHTPGVSDNAREATCMIEGYTGDSECTVCGAFIEGTVIEKPAHNYVDDICADCGWKQAGLYIDGELAFTWEEMKANSYVTVDEDGGLTGVAKSLYGELVVEEGVWMKKDGIFTESGFNSIWLPSSVTEVRYALFEACTALEEVRFFGPITIVDNYAFVGCTALKHIELPEGTVDIDYNAFEGCTSLETVVLPDTLVNIRDRAFNECTSLKSINIPASVQGIGAYAFNGCASLKSVELPEGMTYLGEGAFYNAGVADFVVPSTVTSFGRQQSPTMVKLDLSKTSFTYLESYHFAYASALEEVALPATLTGMGDGTFTDCASLKRLVLPDGFTTIDDNWGYSFAGNTALTEVVWPVSLTDGSLFAEAPALKTIYYRGSELQWDLTASKELLRGKEIIFNYEGE